MNESNAFGSAEELLSLLVKETFRLNGAFLAAGDHLTKESGITSSLWQVLGALSDSTLSIPQIARNFGITRQSVRRTVNLLHEKGYVSLVDNPDHKRSKLVMLNDKGHELLHELGDVYSDWLIRIVQNIDKEHLNSAVTVMKQIQQHID